jgi:hypothetical protein
MNKLDPVIPPVLEMEGEELVTEGIITLGRVAEILEQKSLVGENHDSGYDRENGATRIVDMLQDSDRVFFMVGTRITDTHQDPNIP